MLRVLVYDASPQAFGHFKPVVNLFRRTRKKRVISAEALPKDCRGRCCQLGRDLLLHCKQRKGSSE